MLNKFKIGPKLIGGFLLVTVIAAIIGIVGINNMNAMAKADKFLFEEATVPIGDLAEMSMTFEMVLRELRDVAREKDPGEREKNISGIEEYWTIINNAEKHYETTVIDESDKKNYDALLSVQKNIIGDLTAYYSLLRTNKESEALAILDNQIEKHSIEEENILKNMTQANIDEAQKTSSGNQNAAKNSALILILVMIIGAVLAVIIGLLLTRSITKPLGQSVETLAQMAKGNLLVNFDPHTLTVADETGILTRAMKEMSDQLKSTIAYALEASENVSTGSIQLSTASQNISQGSSEQASSVEEISSSIEEITASINQNADNANQTEKIAVKSSIDAKEGGEAVQKTVIAMKQIAEKISIIQEIARQTNLLSLNASIEAARAGEHGKGFAVVASAVQKLAERSQDAAEEISKLSKSSVDVAEKAGEMLSKLVPDIQKTADLVSEINAASAEQNKGIQQINIAVQQFNQVVQSNASASEELASTSEELSTQAEELSSRLSFFKVDNNNHKHKSEIIHKDRNQHNHTHTTHATGLHASQPIAQKEKQHNHLREEDSVERKGGVALDMSDDEDKNFQRM